MENIRIRYFISVSIIAFMITSVFALPVINDDYSVQAATKKVKVIYKANGGKFTAAKYASKSKVVKKVKKGKKRGTAPKIKRTGYTLKGWYTKKSGGKKVTAKTKIKKRTVLYARWVKSAASANANIDPKLVGNWRYIQYHSSSSFSTHSVSFRNDGTFIYSTMSSGSLMYGMVGNYKVSNGWVTLSNVIVRYGSGLIEEDWLKTYKAEYRFEKVNDVNYKHGEYLNMCLLLYSDKPELPLDLGWARWSWNG